MYKLRDLLCGAKEGIKDLVDKEYLNFQEKHLEGREGGRRFSLERQQDRVRLKIISSRHPGIAIPGGT